MATEAIMAISAFKTAFDIAKALRDMDDAVKRNAAVYDLWEKITAIQEQYTAAIEQVGALKAELARFEAWESEKQKYELHGLNRAGFAYVLKPAERGTQPPHGICPQCYENRIKSILQPNGAVRSIEHAWLCNRCDLKVIAYRSAFEEIFSPATDHQAQSPQEPPKPDDAEDEWLAVRR